MFAQFFGGYLFNHKLCTAEDLTQAFEAKKHTRLRLGVLAINAGLMTAEQVEHVNYVTLLFKNLIRFIGDDFTPMEASVIKNFAAEHIVIQKINGKYNAEACIATDSKTYMAFAERFAKESFTEVDDFVNATAGEFLNVNDGLFVVNESNEHGVELTLTPQEFLENGELALSGTAFCIPVNYPFGKLNFIIAT